MSDAVIFIFSDGWRVVGLFFVLLALSDVAAAIANGFRR